MGDFTNNTTPGEATSGITPSGVESSDAAAASGPFMGSTSQLGATSQMGSTSQTASPGRHLRAVATTTQSSGWNSADLSHGEISDRVAGLAGRISAATCDWLGYVAEADRRGVWSGFASCAAWLSWRCGLGLGTAADHLRVARALIDLPVVREHFASGSLSYSQVRALIRGAGLVPEDELVDLARHATGAQLERLVRALRRVATEDEEQAAAGRQWARWHVDDDGSLVISARLSGEWAEAWLAALEQAKAQARAQTGGQVSQAAVMATVAGRALSAPADAGVPAPTVAIIADLEALTAATALIEQGATSPIGVSAESATGVSAESAPSEAAPSIHWETTGAPASIVTLAAVLHHAQIDLIARLIDGTLVDLGRARRRPSARLARTVLRRHGDRCAHPHCRTKVHLHLHHIQPWSRGGATSAANLIPLCGRHHRELHRGGFRIIGQPTAASASPPTDARGKSVASFMFISATGRPVTAVAGNHADHKQPLVVDHAYARAGQAGLDITAVTNRAERLNLDYAVGVLLGQRTVGATRT